MTVALSRQNLRKWIDSAIRHFRSNDLLGVSEAWLKIYESLADYICDELPVDTKLLWMLEGTNDSPADIIFQLQRLKDALTETACKEKKLEELIPVIHWFDHAIVVLVEKASGQISTKRSLLAPYETIFWNARDGMYISTIDGKFIHVNEALLNMFHFDQLEDLLEMDIRSELYEDREARQVMLDHLMQDGFFDKHEFRFRCADGKIKTALESCFLVENPSSKPYIAGVLVDVTQEREAERKNLAYVQEIEKQGIDANLRLTQEIKRFEALANVNDHPVLILEVGHFGIRDANMAFHRRFRYGKKQLEQLSFRDLFPPEDWNRLYGMIQQSLNRNHYHVRDLKCVNALGEPFSCVLSILVQRDETGPLLFVQIEDKTEHLRITKQRDTSRRNLKQLLQAMPLAVMGFRHDGSIALLSKHLLELLGFSRRKMLNPSFINELFTIEEHRLKFHKYLKHILTGHHVSGVKVSLKTSKDKILDFELSTLSFQFEDEEKPGCLAILKNTTAQNALHQLQKRQESKPQEQDQLLAELEAQIALFQNQQKQAAVELEKKQTFIQLLTHQFQDPLEVVLGYASFLQQSFSSHPDQSQKEDLQIINDHLSVLLTTLDTAREYAMVSSGAVKAIQEPYVVRQLLDDLFKRLEPEGLPPELEFVTEHQVLSMDWQIFTDIDLLEALFIQVLRNARSHTEKGTISLTAFQEEQKLCFEVLDTGKGIQPTELPRIFEPFYPNNRHDDHSGMPRLGLGLAIVDAYVKLLGGECEIQSKLGMGTKFILWLDTP